MTSPDVIVIGGGINGLVAGAWLARRKIKTLILEERASAGGGAATQEIAPGFLAPVLSHALGPIHPIVIRALDLDRTAGLEFITPDPSLTNFGRNGEALVFHRDPVLAASAIQRFSPRDAGRWREFLHTSQRIASVLAAMHRHTPPSIDQTGPRDWWQLLGLGRRARALGTRDLIRLTRWLPMPVADVVDEWFEHELIRAAIAARAIFGNFAGPRSAGTGGMLLQRLAEDPSPVGSGTIVRGGFGVLIDALTAAARRAGAAVETSAVVREIATDRGRTSGVVLDTGRFVAARTVVAAIDPRRVMRDLVAPTALPPTFLEGVAHIRGRGVSAKINLALSALPAMPALAGDDVPVRGRLLFAPDLNCLERAHDASKYGELPSEPWLDVSIPSVADPSLAPSGAHVMSIYAQAIPRHLRAGSWEEQREALFATVIRTLAPHMPNLESLIVQRQIVTPEDLELRWGFSGGHIFHGDTSLDQMWLARPLLGWSQYRTPLDGLFLASAGTHPGGGLTGLSGLLAAQAVERSVGRS